MKLEDAIKELKKRVDIVQIIGQSVKLTKHNNSYFGLCPFHSEKTPSLSVKQDSGYFKCFGCNASGDIFEFIQRQTGRLFIDVVRDLAARYRIEINNNPQSRINNTNTQQLVKMHELFQKQLCNDPLKYLIEKRKYSIEDIKKLEFGFGGNVFGLFKNRITIPIYDHNGRLVAFGGRIFFENDNRVKYVNSASSDVYNKSNILFGLYNSLTLIKKNKFCVIVEGYFDVISLFLMNIPSVASCGTSLTKSHVELLKRYTENVILCFDQDKAGQDAHWKALKLLLNNNFKVKTITLTDKDVDTVWQHGEIEKLIEAFKNPIDAIEVLVEKAFNESLSGIQCRIRALEKIISTLTSISDPLIRRQYVRLTASRFKEDEYLLLKTVLRARLNYPKESGLKNIEKDIKTKIATWSDLDRLLLWVAISSPESIIEYNYNFQNINSELKYLIEELKNGKDLLNIEINRKSNLFIEIKKILFSGETISVKDIDKIFSDLSKKDDEKKIQEKIKLYYEKLVSVVSNGNLDEIRKCLKIQKSFLKIG